MRRREVLKLIACATAIAPSGVAAQTAAKTYRVGTLTVGQPIAPTEGTGKMLVGVWRSAATNWETTSPMKRVVRREKSRKCRTWFRN